MKRFVLTIALFCLSLSHFAGAATLDFNWSIPKLESYAGVETDGTDIYCIRYNGTMIRHLDKTGKDIDSFSITGVTSIRDLTYDGQYFYGGSVTNKIYIMDFKNKALIGTINSPNQTVRSIAYDPTADGGKGAFWVGNWDTYSFSLVSRAGTEISSMKFDNSKIPGVYGTAFDNITPGGPYLWCLHANSGLAPYIFRIHIPTATIMTDIIQIATSGTGGGLCLTETLFPGKTMLIGTIQGTNMFGYDLKKNLTSSPDDIAMLTLNLNKYIKAGEVTISGTLSNAGTQNTITSFDLNWQATGGPVNTNNITGVNIARFASYTFTHSVKWNPTAGQYKVKVWVSNVNGGKDLNTANDTLSTDVIIYNQTAPKKVLFEEFSTTQCGYCPDGHLVLDGIITKYPNSVVPVIHHSGYYTDAMTLPEGETYATEYAKGAPTAAVDRVYIKQSRDVWEQLVADQSTIWSPASVSVSNTFNNALMSATAKVKVKFVDTPVSGDIRLNLWVIEDKVVGSGTGYDQSNYYNTTNGHPMFGKGNPVVGYVHRHVARKVVTPIWGDAGIVPGTAKAGDEFSKDYTFNIDPKWNLNNLILVAFASYNAPLSKDRAVLNSEEAKFTTVTAVDDNPGEQMSVYPNPATDQIKFIKDKYQGKTYSIFSIVGKKIAEGINDGNSIDISNLNAGCYYIIINNQTFNFVRN